MDPYVSIWQAGGLALVDFTFRFVSFYFIFLINHVTVVLRNNFIIEMKINIQVSTFLSMFSKCILPPAHIVKWWVTR